MTYVTAGGAGTAPASLGDGPIEALHDQLANGEIDVDTARQLAATLGKSGILSAEYVHALGSAAYNLLQREQWRDALQISLLLRAATAAAPAGTELAKIAHLTGASWIDMVSVVLWYVPDARLYAEAMQVGEALLATARAARNTSYEASLLHTLGTLNLDPWFANRSSDRYRSELGRWYRRAEAGEGWDGRRYPPDTPVPLPTPEEALAKSERFYRDSAALKTGSSLGRTLSALAQVLQWQKVVSGKDRSAEARTVLARAMEALDMNSDAPMIARVFAHQSNFGVREVPERIERLLAEPPDALVRRVGQQETLDIYLRIATALSTIAPPRAVRLMHELAHVVGTFADERGRENWRDVQIRALVAAEAPGAASQHTGDAEADDAPRSVRAELTAALERARTDVWNERQFAAELVRLARRTTVSDEEPLGVELLDRAEQIAPLSMFPFKEAIGALRCVLLVNSGAVAFDHDDYTGAATHYAGALQAALRLEAPSLESTILDRLVDVAGQGGAQGARAVLETLLPHGMALHSQLGEAGLTGVRRVCDHALGALATLERSPDNDDTRAGLWQIAKGLQFGALLTSGASHAFSRSRQETEVLAEIDALRAQLREDTARLTGSADVLQGALDDETILLAPYSRSGLQLPGQTARERLTNLELRYEELIDERLRAFAGDEGSHVIAAADLRAAIDPGMVLLDLLEVVDKEGGSTLHYAVWTCEGVHFELRELPSHTGRVMRVGEVEIPLSALSEKVQATRASLQLEPAAGDALVSAEGAEDLAYMGDFLLGPIWQRLATLRGSGKRHLCIVPHGPLHYLPFQLLVIGGKPLAEQWDISYLPNTRMLLGNRGLQAVRRHRTRGAAAIGVSFSGTPDALPEALTEVRDVAAVSGGRAFQEADATESALLRALRGSRMVHVATHGDLTSGAAAFQRLYLSSDGPNDGLLHAHELLGLDARGLQLVTLSACGTALGRFDAGDNLRGLIANLFLAGAETAVGTLWDLESSAASTFFRAMYRALAADATRFAAFKRALEETKKAHPAYRDWGTFYYSGDWA